MNITDLIKLTYFNDSLSTQSHFKISRIIDFINEMKSNPPDTYFDFMKLQPNLSPAIVCCFTAILLLILSLLTLTKWRLIPIMFFTFLQYVVLVILHVFVMPIGIIDILEILFVTFAGTGITLHIFFNVKLNIYAYILFIIGNNLFQIIYSAIDSLSLVILLYIIIACIHIVKSDSKTMKITSLFFIIIQGLLVCAQLTQLTLRFSI
ncbi:Uncharacterized protein QTN25_007957 [Entamoeba marina]